MGPATPPQDASASTTPLTPYALKTTSVPTSAKIYRAVPLDEDLHSELEGSIINESKSTRANHFVLHFYVSLKKLQPGFEVPDIVRLKQLYDPQSRCWQPIHLPHILRHATAQSSTTHNQAQGSSETLVGHASQSEPVQNRQKRPQTRALTIQRTVEGPNNNSVIETEQGTYLPRAGSEEKRTAMWLDSVVAALHSLRSKSKAVLPDMGRQWSGEFATKPAPSELDLKMKPDVALLGRDPFDPKGRSSWRNVVAFLELSSSQDFSPVAKQLARKAFAVFAAQPGRRFVLALSILHLQFRLHCFDRVGCVHSRDYSIHRHARYFTRVLYVLTYGPEELVGYDPTISFSLIVSRKNRLSSRPSPTIRIGDDTYVIVRLLFNSEQIRGRATLCFVVIKEGDPMNRQYVVKCSWTRKGRSTTEEQMLKRIQERGLEYGVPTLVKAWTVQIGGADDSTALRRPDHLLKHLREDEQPEIRIQRRLLLEPVGVPLEGFSCIQELLSVLIDIVDVHELLVIRCGILHRDISIKNILMYTLSSSVSWPIRSNDETIRQRLTARETIIQQRNFRRGLLIDFDYAKFLDQELPASEGERTGTIPFMALEMLMEFGSESTINISHKPKHDLESIIYVLVWMCVLYWHPNSPQVRPIPAQETCLRPWVTCKTRQDVEALWSTKTGELHTRVPIQHFTPYFQCLKHSVEKLYAAIVNDQQNVTPLTHDVLKTILLDAFLEVQEPELDSDHPDSGVRKTRKRKVEEDAEVAAEVGAEPEGKGETKGKGRVKGKGKGKGKDKEKECAESVGTEAEAETSSMTRKRSRR